jgi:hypothetical protein
VGAQADVLATGLGPDATTLLHIGNRAGQVGGCVGEMIDQHDPIIPAPIAADEPGIVLPAPVLAPPAAGGVRGLG